MTRIDIDLIDSKIHLTSWPRKLSLNAEEALRVYEAIGAWLGLDWDRDPPAPGPWIDNYDQEPWANSEFIAGAG